MRKEATSELDHVDHLLLVLEHHHPLEIEHKETSHHQHLGLDHLLGHHGGNYHVAQLQALEHRLPPHLDQILG